MGMGAVSLWALDVLRQFVGVVAGTGVGSGILSSVLVAGFVVGVVSLGDNFLHGRAIGYDAKTGEFLWSFDVVPGPGEPGHETWPQDSDVWKYGGGAIWTTPSVDAELGLVYLPTGNAVAPLFASTSAAKSSQVSGVSRRVV